MLPPIPFLLYLSNYKTFERICEDNIQIFLNYLSIFIHMMYNYSHIKKRTLCLCAESA